MHSNIRIVLNLKTWIVQLLSQDLLAIRSRSLDGAYLKWERESE